MTGKSFSRLGCYSYWIGLSVDVFFSRISSHKRCIGCFRPDLGAILVCCFAHISDMPECLIISGIWLAYLRSTLLDPSRSGWWHERVELRSRVNVDDSLFVVWYNCQTAAIDEVERDPSGCDVSCVPRHGCRDASRLRSRQRCVRYRWRAAS